MRFLGPERGYFQNGCRWVKAMAMSGLLLAFCVMPLSACELCAIYSASNARADASGGFIFTLAEQYISQHTLLFQSRSASQFEFFNQAYLNSSYTHFVPGYNFSSQVGVSLNVPIVHRDFRRAQQFSPSGDIVDETGTVTGLGDTALIGRLSLLRIVKMKYSINVNLLAGIKFPTGDTARLDDEVNSAKADLALYGPGHEHGALGGIHQHELSLGSGSFDGVFGLTPSLRWKRWFLNSQIQYYLRSEGHSYKFGDLFIVSGGPGFYVPLGAQSTISLQFNGFYERGERDKIIGQTFNQTGLTAWYLGPLMTLTLGEHLSANASVDVPLKIYNEHGLQTVPDYRINAGLTWRF